MAAKHIPEQASNQPPTIFSAWRGIVATALLPFDGASCCIHRRKIGDS